MTTDASRPDAAVTPHVPLATTVAAMTATPTEKQAEVRRRRARRSRDAALNLELLRSMLLQRRFEERCAEAYALGKIGGFCHLYIGQEAVSTGTLSLLRPDDYVITTYRDHGQALARGMTPRAVMAELFGRSDGCARGKGGSMHMFDKQHELPRRPRHRRRPRAARGRRRLRHQVPRRRPGLVCFMGESVVNTGAFHEALNMAALWKLPVRVHHREQPLRHGHGARARVGHPRHLRARRRVQHAARRQCDGQDVFAVRAGGAARRSSARARSSMPTLLEMRTYRFMGHSMSDAVSGTYRTKAELEEHMKRDPIIAAARAHAGGRAAHRRASFTKLDEEIKAIVQDAWDFADASPEPPLEALYEDVLVDTTDLSRGRTCQSSRTATRSTRRSAKRCSATTASSSWARKSPSTRARTRSPRDCCRSSARCASSTRRSPSSASPASASARRWWGCARSSSS